MLLSKKMSLSFEILVLILSCAAHLAWGAASPGCGLAPPVEAGKTTTRRLQVDGLEHVYLLRLPANYHAARPVPLVVSHGGWGVTASQDEALSGLSTVAEAESLAVAYVRGYDDNEHTGLRWTSFNTIGSVGSTPEAPTCLEGYGTARYCYASCEARPQGCDAGGCDWTTCVNSTAVTAAVLDDVEATVCVETSREYATGQSNGGMMSFRLGVALYARLAAIVPVSATFTAGFAAAPNVAVAALAVSGDRDTVVPVNATPTSDVGVSSEGWLYAPLDGVFESWRVANGCSATMARWNTPLDGVHDLYCWGFVDGCKAPVVRCAWDGAHQYFGHDPVLNGRLVWSFLSHFAKPTHLGAGLSEGSPRTTWTPATTRPLDDVPAKVERSAFDPSCADGSVPLDLSDQRQLRVCVPPCRTHGDCSSDAEALCLASADASGCVLACVFDDVDDPLGERSDCPAGAVCVAGFRRNRAMGVCAFPDDVGANR